MQRFVIGLVVILTLVACSVDDETGNSAQADASGPAGAAAEVQIGDASFSVDEITITAGQTVTWTNGDDVGHTITHGEDGVAATGALFDEPINVDQTVSFTFTEPGTYPVTCTIHPAMQMTVVVEAP